MELVIYIIIGLIIGVCLTIIIKGFMPSKKEKNSNNNITKNNRRGKLK